MEWRWIRLLFAPCLGPEAEEERGREAVEAEREMEGKKKKRIKQSR